MLEAVCQRVADDGHMIARFEFWNGRLLAACQRFAKQREDKQDQFEFHFINSEDIVV